MRLSKHMLILYLAMLLSIIIALCTAKAVHKMIRHFEMNNTIILGCVGVFLVVRFGVRVFVYVRKVWDAMKFIRKYKL